DRARTSPVSVEDLGELASLRAAHQGYRQARHQRRVTLYRDLEALLIEDDLDGRGVLPVEVRFQLAGPAQAGPSEALRARVRRLQGRLGPLDVERAVRIGERAALVPRSGHPLSISLGIGWMAPRFGRILQ